MSRPLTARLSKTIMDSADAVVEYTLRGPRNERPQHLLG